MNDPDDDWLGLLPGDDDGARPHGAQPTNARPNDDGAYAAPPARPSAYGASAPTPPAASARGAGSSPGARRRAATATDNDVWLAPAPGGTPSGGDRRVRRRRRLLRTAGIALAVIVLFVLAIGPQIPRNLSTSVANGDTTITLRGGGDEVTVVAPDGWHIVRPFANGRVVALETPDSRVEITFTLEHRPGAETPPDAADLTDGKHDVPADAWSVEPPNQGTTATYVVLDQPDNVGPAGLFGTGLFTDGAPAEPALVAAIAPAPPHASGAVVDALATSDVPFEPYLAEFAKVVASLEFAS